MAIALGMGAVGIMEPAVAKVPKDCKDKQHHQATATDECRDIIIENLERGSSTTAKFYRNNSRKAKKHRSHIKTN